MSDRRKKFKVVRRGQKYCVRVKGPLNTTETFRFCYERKMSYHIKQPWLHSHHEWDYDFIFDEEHEVTAFIMGMIV
jgi:hypothetical protein